IRIARFGLKFVLFPFRIATDDGVLRSLENNFIALASDRAESAVGVHQIERIVGIIHQLSTGSEIEHGRDAQIRNQDRQSNRNPIADVGRSGFLSRSFRPPDERWRQEMTKECIIEAGQKWN